MRVALDALRRSWPRGLPVATLFPGRADVLDDLRLLHRHGLIELRLPDAPDSTLPRAPLNERERAWGGTYAAPHARGLNGAGNPIAQLRTLRG